MPRRLLTTLFAVGLVLVMVSAVSASIPYSTTGKYVACMDRYGKIRLIDHQAGKRCTSTEKSLTWNQRGPVGPKGATGEAGAQGAAGDQGPKGEPGEPGQFGTTAIETFSLPLGTQQYDGEDVATVGPFTFRAECSKDGTLWHAGWYVKTSAEHSLVDLQNGYTLEPTDNYHVDGMIVNSGGAIGGEGTWVPRSDPFIGVGPDGSVFSAHLWLGFKVLGSTANECQFGGTIAH